MAPLNRTLQDGMSVPSRPSAMVVTTSSRLLIWGWLNAAPPHTVWRFGTATTDPLNTFCPPCRPGPWHRSQLNPSWFSSVPARVVRWPRSTDWASINLVSSLLVFGSEKNTRPTPSAIPTTRIVPHRYSFSRRGFSRSGSDGPGFIPGGMSSSAPRRGRRIVAIPPITAMASARPEATPMRMAFPVDSAASIIICSCHAEGPLGGLVDGVGAARRTGGGGPRVDLDLVRRDRHGETLQAVGRRAQLILAGVVVLGPVAWALEPLTLLAE